jgi:crotonobetainyl-CoA:carnitine CoA-transferase CaiB-like acyl-CoA transferase
VQDGVPTGGENPVVDYMCAMTLAFGVASALLRRARTGRGGEVDASLLMSALMIQNNNMVRIDSADRATHTAVRGRLAELRAAGRPYAEQAALTPQIRPPGTVNVYYRTYATRDAALAVACGSPALRRAFIKAIGLSDDALDRPIADRAKEVEHYLALRQRVEAIVATRTTAEWQTTLEAAGVPAAGVKLPLELLDDEQPLANGMLHDLTHPVLGPVRVLAPPLGMDGGGFVPAQATAPFGSETQAILGELGFSSAEVDALLAEGVTRDRMQPRAGR